MIVRVLIRFQNRLRSQGRLAGRMIFLKYLVVSVKTEENNYPWKNTIQLIKFMILTSTSTSNASCLDMQSNTLENQQKTIIALDVKDNNNVGDKLNSPYNRKCLQNTTLDTLKRFIRVTHTKYQNHQGFTIVILLKLLRMNIL